MIALRPLRVLLPLALAGLPACAGTGDGGSADGAAAGPGVVAERPASPLPDPDGWGAHVLALAVAPDGAVWVGTYGQGIFVSRSGRGDDWERIVASRDDSMSISWDFVNAFAFTGDETWYGTVGNGWGVSLDGGRTWENWTFRKLGPRWQYVVPNGIAVAGDTVFVATADGLRITADDGENWREVTEDNGLFNKYLLALGVTPVEGAGTRVRVAHLRGVSESADGGRTWTHARAMGGEETRALLAAAPEADAGEPVLGTGIPAATCAHSDLTRRICEWTRVFRGYPDPGGEATGPSERRHFRFARPVRPEDNPRLDQTYTYGSTMGGNFQQHQGVEFNVPEGTPIHAIGDGTVAFAGEAEAGALTVVVRHDEPLDGQAVWSTYFHNLSLSVREGDRVRAGDEVARAGNTGRATNDHLHLEIHVTPPDADVSVVVSPDERYPPFTRNPQLWIEPLPGTGAIAGRVFDAAGEPVPGARVYGVTKPGPVETPFSFAETYEDRANPDPVFQEHFAIGDVPAGMYVLGVKIEGAKVWRKVRVEAGKVTEVEFRPQL
ncbi:MAG: peptidoglycan DD-metalloendopeptidase family protein [Gemmatimonadota bacterium]|nr:peptidoglycan DD-metalloendopeptidase family protein [Gemmatimonadota bacterium]